MRIIPCLLIKDGVLVKGKNFTNHRYVGDPINAVRIFNAKEVDEIIFLDISATLENKKLSLKLIEDITDECYVPFTVGGGIQNIEEIRDILYSGAEKVCLNTVVYENPELVRHASNKFGSQAIIVAIDVKKNKNKCYDVYSHAGTKKVNCNLLDHVKKAESLGAGEILINSIDKDGTKASYDKDLLKMVSDAVNIPVIAAGGASSLEDFKDCFMKTNISALAAGAFFVFHGARDAVLIRYPNKKQIANILSWREKFENSL
jgi:imidazole glycerol-phosphate synthase subunit HisF